MNVELREITNRPETFDSSVMSSSVMPSAKYSCFGSSLMLVKGSTAIDGLSGSGNAMRSIDAGSTIGFQGRHQTAAPTATIATRAAPAAAGQRHGRIGVVDSLMVLPDAAGSISTR